MLNKRVIFMGTPKISSIYLDSLIRNNYNIISVYSQPPRKKGRGMKIEKSLVHQLALSKNINVFTPSDFYQDQVRESLEKQKPDLIIVMAYGLKLPKFVLDLPSLGCINIHVSLLPRWRGAAPIEHALMNGDKKTGISIFKLVEEMDAGPILKDESIEIINDINNGQLTEQLNIIGIKLLNTILPKIFDQKIAFKNQDRTRTTYAPKISTNMRKLNFDKEAKIIHNKIRAFSPQPAAWFFYKNERIKIIEASFVKGDWKSSTVINDQFHIGCQDGKICPILIQREGKKPMKLKEFLRGFIFEIDSIINV
jgi:methionyl-tRNA formyltransferase